MIEAMKFLGIQQGHNATLCLVEDGRVTFCQSEERLNRLKNSSGFPYETLRYVYEHIARPEEIDRVVFYMKSAYSYLYLKNHGFRPTQYAEFLEGAFIARSSIKHRILETDLGWKLYSWKAARTAADPSLRREAHEYYTKTLRLPADRIEYLDHHLSHAYSVVPSVRSWGRALIFTLDAQGDDKCASVNLLEGDGLRVLRTTDHRNSLGYYYGATTRVMGMRPGEHEYKIMGLAPYARPSAYRHVTERLMHLLSVDDEGQWHSRPTPTALTSRLLDAYRYERFDSVAGAIQELTETLVCKWIEHWVRKTGCGDVGVAGGVFMNVKLSQRVLALPGVARLFVMPSAADESCAIGCANWASMT
jgi:carbamoyltransferase